MKKFSYILAIAFLAVPFTTFAAAVVTVSDNTTLLLPSDGSSYTLVSGSTFDQLDISGGSFTFGMTTGETVTVTSADKKALSPNPAFTVTCGSSQSSVVITVPSSLASQSVTLTPSGSCSDSSTTANPNTGGGGTLITSTPASSGGGSPPPAPTPVPTPAPATPSASAPGQTPVAKGASTVIPALVQSVFFKKLSPGAKGDEVRQLQALLKQDKTLNPGGIVNGIFGPATTQAVKKFQKKYGISQTGTVGPLTRTKLMQIFGSSATPAAPKTTPSMQVLQDQITQLLKQLQELQKNKK